MMNADKFRKTRKETGLTQAAFADALGIGRVHVSDIERGKYNPSNTVTRLAEMFRRYGVPADFYNAP